MAYMDDAGDIDGHFDERLDYAWQGGYRQGVNEVLGYLEGWDDEGGLIDDIRQAIADRLI